MVGIDLIQNFMFAIFLKVYAGLIHGSSVYRQFGFNQVAYTLQSIIFEVTAGFE